MRLIGKVIVLLALVEIVLQVSIACVWERAWSMLPFVSLYECIRACSSLTWVEPSYVFVCYLGTVWYLWG
jgi:hypothetical protein